ncbi:hypothetical protein N7475_003284 [Penicillium sp. IBT 31633x]|nr:hypothetical protein N7475_003284 [Penicillium sp. IBT 31633x]
MPSCAWLASLDEIRKAPQVNRKKNPISKGQGDCTSPFQYQLDDCFDQNAFSFCVSHSYFASIPIVSRQISSSFSAEKTTND